MRPHFGAGFASGSGLGGLFWTPSWKALTGAALDLDFVNSRYLGAPVPEKILNGTFDTDIANWTAFGTGGGSAAGVVWDATGKLSITGTGAGVTGAYQAITTIPGVTYEMVATITGQNGNLIAVNAAASISAPLAGGTITAGQTGTYRFTATQATTYITLYRVGAVTSLIDAVTAKEVSPPLSRVLTTTRASVGMAQHSDGRWESFAAGVPRITTKGLLVEEARTNSIRNNTGQGAVAGSPGTMPTNWPTPGSISGISYEVVGVTTEAGIDCVDIRIFGTAGSTGSYFYAWEASTAIAATNTQAWAVSAFIKATANAGTSLPTSQLSISQRDAGGTNLGDLLGSLSATPTTLTRLTHTTTTSNASTAFVVPRILFSLVNGTVYDFVVRIGLPQCEQGTFVTSPIRTTGASATRAMDIVRQPGLTWLDATQGTFLSQWTERPNIGASNGGLFTVSDGTNNNRIGGYILTDNTVISRIVNATTQQEPTALTGNQPNQRNRYALRYGVGTDFAGHILNGNAGVNTFKTSSPTVLPAKATYNDYIDVGNFGNVPLNGYTERLTYWNSRQSDVNLIRLTSGQDVDTGAWALAGASLDMDFVADRYLGQHKNQLTVSRASVGMVDNSAGVWATVQANLPRISDKGLLVEEARTNLIPNSSMAGAVVGTPGTIPTGWSSVWLAPGNGLTASVVGTGTENGLDYIDYRLQGTLTTSAQVVAAEFAVNNGTNIPVSASTAYTASFFCKLVSGSLTGIAQMMAGLSQFQADNTTQTQNSNAAAFIPDSVLTRYSVTATTPALTAIARPRLRIVLGNAGEQVNLTLRVATPQLELGAFVTSPIRTTGAAATRAADVVTMSPAMVALMAGAAGTMYAKFRRDAAISAAEFPRLIDAYAGGVSINQRCLLFLNSSGVYRTRNQENDASSVLLTADSATGFNTGVSAKTAGGWDATDIRSVLNGGSVTTNVTARTPAVPTQGYLANRNTADRGLNGYLERVALYPTKLDNASLQALTT